MGGVEGRSGMTLGPSAIRCTPWYRGKRTAARTVRPAGAKVRSWSSLRTHGGTGNLPAARGFRYCRFRSAILRLNSCVRDLAAVLFLR
jgi:hypothetical protein